jgi:hypothetical protein
MTGSLSQCVAASNPSLIAFQPVPISYKLRALEFDGGKTATAIERVWNVGDTERCRLCRQCEAVHERGVCVILVDGSVSGESALLFTSRGFTACRPAPRDLCDPADGRD